MKALWLFLAALVLLLARPLPALAGLTPAGTVISNQSVASFEWEQQTYKVSSNIVTNQVMPVYGVEVTPNGDVANPGLTVRAPSGAEVAFPYILMNAGNVADSFRLDLPYLAGDSDFEPHVRSIHLDANANGILDPGESDTVQTLTNVAPGAAVHLLVMAAIPASASPGDASYLNLTGQSVGDPARTDENNVGRILVSEGPRVELRKSSSVAETTPGALLTYTLDAVNSGAGSALGDDLFIDGVARTGVFFTDVIPEYSTGGTEYVAGSLSGSPTGRRIFSTNGGVTWTEAQNGAAEPAANLVTNIGFFIDNGLVTGQSARVEFSVRVASDHDDQPIRNTAGVRYQDAGGALYEDTATNQVEVAVTVPRVGAVFIGPKNQAAAVGVTDLTGDAAVDDNDDETLDPGVPASGQNPQGTQVTGNAVVFYNTVRNGSPAADTLNILAGPGGNLPQGWIVRYYQADGITPLKDTNGDGEADTGPLNAGAETVIVVELQIPSDAEPGDNNGQGFRTVVMARSTADPAAFNLTHDTVPRIMSLGNFWDPFEKAEEADYLLNPGSTIPYVNTFGNHGPGDVYNAVIRDELSQYLNNVGNLTQGTISDLSGTGRTISVAGAYSPTTHIVTWHIPHIPPGFKGQVRFTADVAQGVEDGTEIPNTFTITSDQNRIARVSNQVANVVGIDRVIQLEKTANLKKAEVGDPILYTITAKNTGADPLSGGALWDFLPRGFRYLDGSARVDGVAWEPFIADTRQGLRWDLGTLAPGQEITVTYVLVATVDALKGEGLNTAVLTGRMPQGSKVRLSTEFQVDVDEGIFNDKSVILGKVFIDQNDNRVQDEAEPGIEGVRLYLEDGTYVLTDREGKYHFEGIDPGVHSLLLDETTLPENFSLGVIDSQNAMNPASRFVELKYGTPHKANFRVLPLAADKESRGPDQGNTLLPIRLCMERDAVRVVIECEKPVEAKVYRDEASGVVHVALPGVTRFEGNSNILAEERNLDSIRTEVDEAGGLTKVQVRLRKRTSGYPVHEVIPTEKGVFVDAGAYQDPDNDPREAPYRGPGDPGVETVILSPEPGASFISRSLVTVKVAAHLGARYELLANGKPVDKGQIGSKQLDIKNRRATYEYVGVPLNPGKNVIRFETNGPGANNQRFAEVELLAADTPQSIRVDAEPVPLMADGKTEPQLFITLLDENSVPTGNGGVITVTVDSGDILSPDIRPMEAGHQALIKDGRAMVRLSAAGQAETREVKVIAGDLESKTEVRFSPYLRNWIVNGVASATVSGGDKKDSYQDGGRETWENDYDGRMAVFAKGRLPGEVSLTAAYDSDKDTENRKIFQEIDPLKYYPVYGDSSQQQYEAQSREKLYVKAERGASYAMYGDFKTEMDKSELAAYDRSFTGAKLHLESRYLDADGFFSRNDQAFVKNEMRGNGTSGYYRLPDADLIQNSEQITIETRDRHLPDVVLETETLNRFTDYTIDYDTGLLLFKRPVQSVDQNFNPVWIVARYEVDGRKSGDYNTFGGRVGLHTPGRTLDVGATYIEDEHKPYDHTIQGVDATWNLHPNLSLHGEYAQSRDREDVRGGAWLLELDSGFERADFTAYYKLIDEAFDNPSLSASTPGRETLGLEGAFTLTENLGIEDQFYTERDETQGDRKNVFIHDFVYERQKWDFTLGGGYIREVLDEPAEEGGDTGFESPFVRAGAGFDVTKKIRLEFLHQQAFGDQTFDQPTHSDLDLIYSWTDNTKYTIGAERRETRDSGHDLNLVAGVESQLTESLSGFHRYTLDDGADGQRVRSGVGLDLDHKLTPELRLGSTAEVSRTVEHQGDDLDGASTPDFWAATLALEYQPLDESSTSSARFEVRDEDTRTSYLVEVGGAVKADMNNTLFAKNTVYFNDNADTADGWIVDALMGWAYRPVLSDKLNLISDVEFKYEDNVEVTDYTQLNRILFSSEAVYQPWQRLVLDGKYACKYVMSGYADSVFSDVKALELRYDLNDRVYVNPGIRWLSHYDVDVHQMSWGVGVGVNVVKDLRVQAGYNFEGFEDRDFSRSEHWDKGWYLGINWKFDQSLFGILGRLEGK